MPTIDAREQAGWLDRCLAAYARHTEHPYEVIVERNHPACGPAWNAGAAKATGTYVHFSADDLEPLPGWDAAAIRCVEGGQIPEARILHPDGSLHSCGDDATERDEGTVTRFTRIPFLTREMLEAVLPIINAHYWTDLWVSDRARKAGWQTVIARDYCFVHHYANEGRLDTYDADHTIYTRKGGR